MRKTKSEEGWHRTGMPMHCIVQRTRTPVQGLALQAARRTPNAADLASAKTQSQS
ncbi:hypothetical protein HAX54_003806, partial [Datura stramonium]|nr:hypothetical protein [Datura stramonium]